MTISREDLIWLAGAIDSRGNISLAKHNGRLSCRIAFRGDLPFIKEVKRLTGINRNTVEANRWKDGPRGPIEFKMHDYLRAEGSRAYIIMINVLPYLRSSKEKCEEAIAGESISFGHQSNRVVEDMVALGWKVG
jgi:hypothetical protein